MTSELVKELRGAQTIVKRQGMTFSLTGRDADAVLDALEAAEAADVALAYECDRFGLPHFVGALVKHIEGNRAMTEAALATSNSALQSRLEAAEAERRTLRGIITNSVANHQYVAMRDERDTAIRLLRRTHAYDHKKDGRECSVCTFLAPHAEQGSAG